MDVRQSGHRRRIRATPTAYTMAASADVSETTKAAMCCPP